MTTPDNSSERSFTFEDTFYFIADIIDTQSAVDSKAVATQLLAQHHDYVAQAAQVQRTDNLPQVATNMVAWFSAKWSQGLNPYIGRFERTGKVGNYVYTVGEPSGSPAPSLLTDYELAEQLRATPTNSRRRAAMEREAAVRWLAVMDELQRTEAALVARQAEREAVRAARQAKADRRNEWRRRQPELFQGMTDDEMDTRLDQDEKEEAAKAALSDRTRAAMERAGDHLVRYYRSGEWGDTQRAEAFARYHRGNRRALLAARRNPEATSEELAAVEYLLTLGWAGAPERREAK